MELNDLDKPCMLSIVIFFNFVKKQLKNNEKL